MKTYYITDSIKGTMDYQYEVIADSEEEAKEIFKNDGGIPTGAEFTSDNDGSAGFTITTD